MDHTSSFGHRLKSARKRRGLTQRELAGLAGVSLSLIRKLEQDERDSVRMETAHKLATALRMSTTMLLPRRGDGGDDANPGAAGDWQQVRRALAGLLPPPEVELGIRLAGEIEGPS
jgi:transcriptional regulator with XRE-family HTH domain